MLHLHAKSIITCIPEKPNCNISSLNAYVIIQGCKFNIDENIEQMNAPRVCGQLGESIRGETMWQWISKPSVCYSYGDYLIQEDFLSENNS